METSPSNRTTDDAESIYDPRRGWASRLKAVRRSDLLVGMSLGAALWFIVAELGLPGIFGLGRLSLLPLPMLAGAIIGATRFRMVLAWVTSVFLVLLLLVAFTPLMEGPTDRLIRRDPLPKTADAIVVLSAGVTLDGLLPQQGLDRLLKGIELARSGVAQRLVLTRERKRWRGRTITTEADQNRLASFAETTVITTGRAASTREEALRVRDLAAKEGWQRIILVTSPFHSRRACATFEKVGLTVSCIPADSRDIAVINLEGHENRARAFSMWLYELAGTIRYWASGWV